MGTKNQLVVVAGATGRTGRLVIKELLATGYLVRAIVRSIANAVSLEQQGIEIVESDLASVQSLEQGMEGATFLISAIGSKKPFNSKENNAVDNLGNQNLAKASLVKGIKHFVLISSVGVGNSKYAINFLFRVLMSPVLRKKGK